MKYYYDKNYKYSENNQNQTYEKQIKKDIYLLNKKYYTSVHKHPLVFLDKSLNFLHNQSFMGKVLRGKKH